MGGGARTSVYVVCVRVREKKAPVRTSGFSSTDSDRTDVSSAPRGLRISSAESYSGPSLVRCVRVYKWIQGVITHKASDLIDLLLRTNSTSRRLRPGFETRVEGGGGASATAAASAMRAEGKCPILANAVGRSPFSFAASTGRLHLAPPVCFAAIRCDSARKLSCTCYHVSTSRPVLFLAEI